MPAQDQSLRMAATQAAHAAAAVHELTQQACGQRLGHGQGLMQTEMAQSELAPQADAAWTLQSQGPVLDTLEEH